MTAEPDTLADEDLMARLVLRDHGAFSVLVGRHHGKFYALAYRSLFDQAEAEDVVQDCFLKIWRKPELWRSDRGAKFTTWFYRIVVNACYDRNKKKRPQQMPEFFDPKDESYKARQEVFDKEQKHQQVEAALKTLPDRQRTALNLCFYQGLSHQEAAEVMNVGIKALETLLMRGKSGLKKILKIDTQDTTPKTKNKEDGQNDTRQQTG